VSGLIVFVIIVPFVLDIFFNNLIVFFPFQLRDRMSATQDVILGRPKAEWTPTRDAYLVELFIDQHNCGRTAYNEFKNEMIRSVTRDFNKRFSMNLEESQVKNRYNVMKKDYGVVKTLLTHTGFGWDESRQMVVADDKVWDSYIAVCNYFCRLLLMH
jgi:hypothetical protein